MKCAVPPSQELALYTTEGHPSPEAIALLLVSQALTLRVLSMHHDALPHRYLNALASLRSLTHLTVRNSLHPHAGPVGRHVVHPLPPS